MPSNFIFFSITLAAESSNYTTVRDLTDDVIDLPLFTDTGTSEVNEARIVLRAPYGKHLATDPIQRFDRVFISCTDLDNNFYGRAFEIDDIQSSQSKDEGTILTLKCLGLEYHTQNIHYGRAFWFSDAFTPGKNVGDVYNANRGSKQPELQFHDFGYQPGSGFGNGLPRVTNTHYEYGFTPTPCHVIWQDLVDRQGAAVRDGGVFDFYELGFDTFAFNTIWFRLFPSGAQPENRGADPVVIEKTLSINPAEGEGVISNPTATRVAVIGDASSGSLPTGRAKYNAHIFEFLYRPAWSPSITYLEGSKVQRAGRHYRSINGDNNTNRRPDQNPTYWEQFDFSDEIGDATQYSEWTDDKAAFWVNSGGNPGAARGIPDGFDSGPTVTASPAVAFDGNIVINDGDFFSTWVDERIVGLAGTQLPATQFSDDYKYANGVWPRGYRFLCAGTGPFVLGASDRYGVQYENSVVERVAFGDTTEWVVKYRFGAHTNRYQIAVLGEGLVYEWRWPQQTFVNITNTDLGGHCFHRWSTMRNIEGFDRRPHETDSAMWPEITKDGNTFAKNLKSAVEVTYDVGVATLDRFTHREQYQSKGAWLNLRFPVPVTTHNAITEGVGDLYGGGTRSVETGINEPATLDVGNLGFTPSGKLGFNQDDSDSLLALTSFSFALKLLVQGRTRRPGQNRAAAKAFSTFDGRAHMRCLMGDTADNVWYFDFVMPERNGTWHSFDLPLSQFEIYRGRKPRYLELNGLENLIDLINPKDLGVPNIFEQRNICWITIQLQDYYDEFGRFAPEGAGFDITHTDLGDSFAGRITMAIDDVHFKKPLLAFSGQDSERNIEAAFLQREDVIIQTQAEEIAKSQEQIEKFQHKEFDIVTSGDQIFDIRFGDSFFLKDSRLVSDSDMTVDGITDTTFIWGALDSATFVRSRAASPSDLGVPFFLNYGQFTPDGRYLLLADNNLVYQINLSTPWDISTATVAHTLDTSAQATRLSGAHFSPDGTRLFVLDQDRRDVLRYNLSTPWDISTGVFSGDVFDINLANPLHIHFSPDGRYLFSYTAAGTSIVRDTFSVPWDITTRVPNARQVIDITSHLPDIDGLWLKEDGTLMYIVDEEIIYQFSLTTPWDLTTIVNDGESLDLSSRDQASFGVYRSPDGMHLYLFGHNITQLSIDSTPQHTMGPVPVPNTIKLVAKRIEYSISRPLAGRGGLQRRIKGIKRFT